jgi:hypothetical protein
VFQNPELLFVIDLTKGQQTHHLYRPANITDSSQSVPHYAMKEQIQILLPFFKQVQQQGHAF